MYNRNCNLYKIAFTLGFGLLVVACKAPALVEPKMQTTLPTAYVKSHDTLNSAKTTWKSLYNDPYLSELIEVALANNQELQITLQEIQMAQNDIRVRKGQLLPKIDARLGGGIEKVGRYTSQGAGDASTEITPGEEMPDPLGDINLGLYANWEVDIWKKLRNSKKAAVERYLATVEGKNFVITNLIAEVADSYYELLALDSQLDVVHQTIALQQNAFDVVKTQKEAARATELAVKKFEAEVLSSKSREFDILQQIKETENKINFLLGRYPQEIKRQKTNFTDLSNGYVNVGIPQQLLENRPDVRKAERELEAAKLDVKVARAEFYPSLEIRSGIGLQAFKPSYLFEMPESLLYSLVGDLAAPLINRNALKAEFNTANARQLQALYNYERTVLTAYLEVSNQLSRIDNLQKSYALKTQQVAALHTAIDASNELFKSARADYFEVLMTQRDALEVNLELIETKLQQFKATVTIYKSLGGGWR